MELKELIEAGELNIIDEKIAEGSMTVKVPFIEADKKTLNGRTYSKNLLTREVDRIQSQIKKGQLLGQGDHPSSGFSDLATASHIVQKLYLDQQGKGFVEMKIVSTERGRSIMTLIDQGARLGVSMRGFGSSSPKGVVQSDYKLLGIDIVTNPSYEEGTFNKNDIFESLEFEDKQDEQRKKDLAEASDNLLSDSYHAAVRDGCWYGSFAEWKEKYGKPIKEVLGLENDEKLALSEEQISARLFSAFQEAISGGFVGSFVEWKEKNPKVVELVIKPKKTTEEDKSSEEEKILSAYREAIEAGFIGSFEKWKTENPKVIEVINRKPLTKQQFAQIEAKRCNVTVETVLKKWKIDEEIKVKENLRKKAIRIINRDLIISGVSTSISKEQRNEMIEQELQALLKERKN